MQTHQTLRAFDASPSDLESEREVLAKAINATQAELFIATAARRRVAKADTDRMRALERHGQSWGRG